MPSFKKLKKLNLHCTKWILVQFVFFYVYISYKSTLLPVCHHKCQRVGKKICRKGSCLNHSTTKLSLLVKKAFK